VAVRGKYRQAHTRNTVSFCSTVINKMSQVIESFPGIEGHSVVCNGVVYVSIKYIASVIGWSNRMKQRRRAALASEDPDLLILWNFRTATKMSPSDKNAKSLIDGRQVAYYVSHEGIFQLLQWERKWPLAKQFRKFVRVAIHKLLDSGTVSLADPEVNKLREQMTNMRVRIEELKKKTTGLNVNDILDMDRCAKSAMTQVEAAFFCKRIARQHKWPVTDLYTLEQARVIITNMRRNIVHRNNRMIFVRK